jgi:predicted nucleic acid-binding protein
VLLDLATDDPQWADWSQEQLRRCSAEGSLWINEMVFAEVSVGFTTLEAAVALIEVLGVVSLPLPREAAFLAGKAFQQYKLRGGTKTSPLPDFFIGAHAAILGVPLLTRDPRRVATSYPRLKLVSPE